VFALRVLENAKTGTMNQIVANATDRAKLHRALIGLEVSIGNRGFDGRCEPGGNQPGTDPIGRTGSLLLSTRPLGATIFTWTIE